jgi:hypothetical protein
MEAMRARVSAPARTGQFLVNVIVVPRPAVDSTLNPSMRRLAVTNPSFGSPVGVEPDTARSKSAMPGPWSATMMRSAKPAPASSRANSARPPPACRTALRATSDTAVATRT